MVMRINQFVVREYAPRKTLWEGSHRIRQPDSRFDSLRCSDVVIGVDTISGGAKKRSRSMTKNYSDRKADIRYDRSHSSLSPDSFVEESESDEQHSRCR